MMKTTVLLLIGLLAVIPAPAVGLDFAPDASYLWGGATSVAADYDIVTVGYPVGLRIFDNSSGGRFDVLGQFEYPLGVSDIVLHGSDLYFTASDYSLHHLDVANPESPQYVGELGAAPRHQLVESNGDWMVTVGRSWLRLFALSDTAAPALVDSSAFTGSPHLLSFSDTLIIVMTSTLDLHSFAIAGGGLTGVLSSDASNLSGIIPVSLGVYDSHVYIANRENGVEIIDYSDPTAPIPREPFLTYGSASDVAVAGNQLLIADQTLGLVSTRLYDPINPYWQDEYNEAGGMLRVWPGVGGRFFASQNTDLLAVDTDALGQVRLVGRFSHPGTYGKLVRRGEVGMFSDVFGVWTAIPDSVETDSSFRRTGLFGLIADLSVDDGMLFTAEGVSGAGIYTVDDAGNLMRQALVDVDQSASVVAVAEDRLVVAQGFYGFEIFDISDPTVPDEIGRYRRSRSFRDAIMPNGRYLYLSETSGSVTVYDFEHPIKPKKLGTLVEPTTVSDMLIHAGHLYLADNPTGLIVYSLANPSAPSHVATRAVGGGVQSLWRSGRTLYAASEYGRIIAYDIGDPNTPVVLGDAAVPFEVKDFAKFGEQLWYLSYDFVGTLDVLPPLVPGDTDNNGVLEPLDLVVLIDYVFLNGSPLIRPNTSDVNGDGSANLVDVVHMVDAVFMNGGPLLPGTLE